MILEFQRDESQISANKGMLFKNVIEHHFLKEWDEKVIPAKFARQKYTDLKIEVLSKLAFFMVGEDDSVKIEEGKAKEIIDDFLKEGRTNYKDIRDELLRQSFKSHILINVGTQVSFWHKSFRDYFAALELAEAFQRDPEEFVNQYVTKRWEESILFFVGIVDDPSDFVDRLIQPFWQYFWKSQSQVMFRLSLAAKCIGANDRISTETQQKVIEQLTKIIQVWESKKKPGLLKSLTFPIFYEVPEAFQALGETKSEKAADFLGEFLEKSNSNYYCQCAVNALRNVPLTEKAQNSLLYAALRHENGVVQRDATKILGESMSQEIEWKLLQVLNDSQEKNEVRINALHTLREHKGLYNSSPLPMKKKYHDEVICSIVKLALEDVGDLKSHAVNTLGFYGDKGKDEIITNLLIHALLNNPDADIRTNAAYALFLHRTHPVRKALIQALNDKSVKVRKMAAHAFRYVGINTEEEENEASRKLLNLFSDEDNTVRINAIDAYGYIRRNPIDAELFHLIKLLKDEDISIRSYAAEALGRLKAECAFDQLNEMVEIERYASPWASAIWAILQIEPNFIEDIKENQWEDQYIRLLYDDDIDERTAAAEILEKIGTDKALPFLKEMASDPVESMGIGRLFPAIHKIEERINM
jgi:HEAT repeat protein